ncbi:MAG TPA: efflux transporter outer membrane subunit [Methylocella sp.]|nr:efflux transporter outer membrane subunit [Methylocella sp.]
MILRRSLLLAVGALPLFLLAGCAAMPAENQRASFREQPPMDTILPHAPARKAEAVPAKPWPEAQWWRTFRNPDLDRAMETALANNPSLKQAFDRIGEANATAQVEGARLLPWLDSDNTFRMVRYAQHGLANSFNPDLGGTYHTSDTLNPVSFRYEFDFWGKNQAAFEAALGEAAAQQAEFAEASLLLTTAIARTYVRGVAASRQLVLAQDVVVLRKILLDYAQTRVRTGLDPEDAVKEASIELETANKVVDATRALVILQQDLLARLMGEGPDATANFFTGKDNDLPAKLVLPAHLPIELLSHRPDLAAAMHRAESQAELIHVAKAEFLPSVDLTAATGGFEATVLTSKIGTLPGLLFRGSDLNYLVAPGFHLPIFEGGRLRGELAASRSAYDQAVESYNETLLRAIQDVADGLTNWRQTKAILDSHAQVLSSSSGEVLLTRSRLGSGLNDVREVASSEVDLLQQRFVLQFLLVDHINALVDIIEALGGGFDDGYPASRPQIAPEAALSGLETLTPAYSLDNLLSPLISPLGN